jgi:hypothetical protein
MLLHDVASFQLPVLVFFVVFNAGVSNPHKCVCMHAHTPPTSTSAVHWQWFEWRTKSLTETCNRLCHVNWMKHSIWNSYCTHVLEHRGTSVPIQHVSTIMQYHFPHSRNELWLIRWEKGQHPRHSRLHVKGINEFKALLNGSIHTICRHTRVWGIKVLSSNR